jgi:hypothetical protein
MYNRSRITNGGRPAQAWQESVVRDRAGDGSSSARSRPFPSSSLPPRPPAAHPSASNRFASRLPASRLPASNPFASHLPASNPFAAHLPASNRFASRLPSSRPLSAPGDGSSDEIESQEFFSATDESLVSCPQNDTTLLELFDNSSQEWRGPWPASGYR